MVEPYVPRFLRRLIHGSRPPTRRPRRLLWLEPLEGRETPAAIVSAVFTGSVLTLTGLDSSVAGDSDQSLAISGTVAGSVSVTAGPNTLFQGTAATTLNFTGVRGVVLDLRTGNDVVSLDNLNLAGGVTAMLGPGDDQISFLGSNTIGGAVTINAGAGDLGVTFDTGTGATTIGSLSVIGWGGRDSFGIAGASFTAAGSVSLVFSAGGSAVALTPAALTIGGNLNFSAGADDELIALNSQTATIGGGLAVHAGGGTLTVSLLAETLSIGGALAVDTGNGADLTVGVAGGTASVRSVALRTGAGDTSTNFDAATTIQGNLAATHGAGHDAFRAADVTVSGSATFNNGPGDSDATFAGNTAIAGNFLITSLAGNDHLTISGPSFAVGGVFSLNFGSGGSTVTVEPATTMNLAQNLLIRATSGEDVIVFSGAIRARMMALSLGEGPAAVTFDGDIGVTNALSIVATAGDDLISALGTLNVGGALSVVTGAGNDTFRWAADAASSVGGSMTISTGAGDDSIDLRGPVTTGGNVRIDAGAGDDEVRINGAKFNGAVAIDMGAGNDKVLIDTEALGVSSTFASNLAVALEAGDDLFDVGIDNDLNNFAVFNGQVRVDGGAGTDTLHYLPMSLGGTRANVFTQELIATAAEVLL
jgi:hypothetical protein